MKKTVVSLMGALLIIGFAGDATNTNTSEVSANPAKTKCFVTSNGGFHCEGNPGYEEALRIFNNN